MDLKAVIDDVALRGISTPVVIRFPQILDAAVKELNEAFLHAIKEYEYDGVFRGVFPIKVNQKKVVVKRDHPVRPQVRIRSRGRVEARASSRPSRRTSARTASSRRTATRTTRSSGSR